MNMADAFAPFEDLARHLLQHLSDADGAHGVSHVLRVWSNAQAIAAGEGGDLRLIAAAVILHDCVAVPKSAPNRAGASRLSAARSRALLTGLGWTCEDIGAVAHAIEAHSFSAQLPAETLEARILQDADRLDALGLVGVARCFHVAGQTGAALYDPADPQAVQRPLDDRRFALDHFRTKLLGLRDGFQTGTGRRMAEARHARLERFLAGFLAEITTAQPGG